MEEKYGIKEFNKGVLTMIKNDQAVVCAFNAQPYVSGASALGQPIFSNTACGSWCPHFQARGESKKDGKTYYEQVGITCGCKEKVFSIQTTELKDDSTGKIVDSTR